MQHLMSCVLVSLAAVGSAGVQPEVHVGGDASRYLPGERTSLVGSDPDYRGDGLLVPPTWTGYKCKEFPQGCPAGATYITEGNVKGCDFVTGPPATCSGTCTSCEGGNTSTELCERDPASSCSLQGGGGSLTDCGKSASVTCGYIPPPSTLSDPRGCTCPAATGYTEENCKLPRCAV